jgi:outer membrane protein assembly factor BamA
MSGKDLLVKRDGLRKLLWSVGLIVAGAAPLSYASAEGVVPGGVSSDRDSVSTFEGRVIDTIVIETRNIYDTSDPQYHHRIFRLANSLHVVTRRKVVRRELLFKVGETYSVELAEEVGRNLRSRHALNDAWVEPEILPDGRLLVRVVTVDRWSLVGGFRLEREGNRTNYQFGFEERNLLGYHQLLSFDYYVQEKEHNYVSAKFFDRRLWGYPLTLDVHYSNDPLASITSSRLVHPYFNLSQRWSYSIEHSRVGGRTDLVEDSIRAGSFETRANQLAAGIEYRWGPYRSKFALGADYRYVDKINYDTVSYDTTVAVIFPEDSLYHRVGAVAEYSSYEFAKVMRITGMKYAEDLTLGFTARLDYARAFGPRFKDFAFDDISLQVGYSAHWGGSVIIANYGRSFVLHEDAVLKRGNRVTLRYYNTSLSFMTVAFRSLYMSETRADNGNMLTLGGIGGMRGYDTYYRTGNRLHVLNSELRFYPDIELLSVIFGGVAFVDLGRTWKYGESQSFRGYFRSWGVGVRLSLEKISRGELIRIDLANSQDHKWQVSIGSRQYF